MDLIQEAELRTRLERLGLYRASGHEHFTGSLVIPVFDAAGAVAEVYGRKITDNLRAGTPLHLYLPGPHRGVWNLPGIAAAPDGEVIVCEALIDALTFWCAGYRNVTASYGVDGFTEAHLAAFQQHAVRRVLIAYDRDEAGERGAAVLAERLSAAGIATGRVEFPHGVDANAYALKVTPAVKSRGFPPDSPAGRRTPGRRGPQHRGHAGRHPHRPRTGRRSCPRGAGGRGTTAWPCRTSLRRRPRQAKQRLKKKTWPLPSPFHRLMRAQPWPAALWPTIRLLL